MFSGGDNLGVGESLVSDVATNAICGDDAQVHGAMTCAEKVEELSDSGGICEAVQTFYDSYTPEEQATLPPEFKALNGFCGLYKLFAD